MEETFPQSQLFTGIRFVLFGYDPDTRATVSQKLVTGGALDAGIYSAECTHVIVNNIEYDDPVCVAARRDGKILLSGLWVEHSCDVGGPAETDSVIYMPPRDLNGIPGAKSLVVCLTGYQRDDRGDIKVMVDLMGAKFTQPLIAATVTHLICYKFEGVKYALAKRLERIKLVNHKWLEDCLKKWEILPEADYSKSGHELEMEAEAKDSKYGTKVFMDRRWRGNELKYFLKLCIEEVNRVGRRGTCLHKESWANMEKKLAETCGIKVTQMQMKNHYDIMKKKYLGWVYLRGKSGNIYNHETNRFNLTKEGWEDFVKVHPQAYSLKTSQLAFPDLCATLYDGIHANSARRLAP